MIPTPKWQPYKGSVADFEKEHGKKDGGFEVGIAMRVCSRGEVETILVGDLDAGSMSTSGCGCCADAYFDADDDRVIEWLDLRVLLAEGSLAPLKKPSAKSDAKKR